MKSVSDIKNFDVQKSVFHEWDTVLQNPQSINIKTLRTGTIISKVSRIINLNNINANQLKDGTVKMPVLVHIVRHQKYGDYLIDTGFDSSFKDIAGGTFSGLLKRFYFRKRYLQEKSSDGIEKQIKDESINLKGVFFTHFHEHAAGVPALPDHIPYIFGDGEQEISFFPFVYSDFFKNKVNLQKMDFIMGHKMPILGNCIDIFGDGSFWAFSTPGHTKGHVSYLINGKEAQTLITGDACISKKGFELGIETGKNSINMEEGRASFLKIIEFTEKYYHIEKIYGHETAKFVIEYR
jgi:glyoxylase-like metal-dependent hydrolase (beta-lactamase superfamily II)